MNPVLFSPHFAARHLFVVAMLNDLVHVKYMPYEFAMLKFPPLFRFVQVAPFIWESCIW